MLENRKVDKRSVSFHSGQGLPLKPYRNPRLRPTGLQPKQQRPRDYPDLINNQPLIGQKGEGGFIDKPTTLLGDGDCCWCSVSTPTSAKRAHTPRHGGGFSDRSRGNARDSVSGSNERQPSGHYAMLILWDGAQNPPRPRPRRGQVR